MSRNILESEKQAEKHIQEVQEYYDVSFEDARWIIEMQKYSPDELQRFFEVASAEYEAAMRIWCRRNRLYDALMRTTRIDDFSRHEKGECNPEICTLCIRERNETS